MKRLKIGFAIGLLSLFAFTTIHKYYVSITQIAYKKEQQSVQIISRIFIDDIEKLIRQRYDETITLATNEEPKIADYYFEKYITEKMQIKINGRDAKLNYLGKEYENDLVYCYLEIKNVTSIQTFQIKNHILYDVYSDQKNIVRTEINGKNKSFILIKENDKGMLNFK